MTDTLPMNLPDTGMPRSDTARGGRMEASSILSVVSAANVQEIQASRYAAQNGSHASVQALARRLQADHANNLQQGRELASQLGVSQRLPSDSPRADQTPPEFQGLNGSELDRTFVEGQHEAHQANIELIRNQLLPAADDGALRDYLQRTLTAMEGHLRQIEQVQGVLGNE